MSDPDRHLVELFREALDASRPAPMADIDDDPEAAGDPPPPAAAEIERACRLIQSGWSADERIRRRRLRPRKLAATAGIEVMARQRWEASLLDRRQAGHAIEG